MNRRGLSAALFIVPVLLAVLVLAGCGGGEQSGDGSQGGGAPGAKGAKQGAGAANKDRPEVKVALGTIVATDPGSKPHGKLVLRPTARVQGAEPLVFKLGKNAKITLDDKEVGLARIKKGQQAQINYSSVKVVNKDTDKTRRVNRALVVQVFSRGGQNAGG